MSDTLPELVLVIQIKFPLGHLVATPGVLESIPHEEMQSGLKRHANGDWGLLDEEDRKANDLALTQHARLLSAYESKAGIRFWIITEADRSVTTFLLPSEY